MPLYSSIKGLPPLIDEKSRFLILGTIPGRKSLEQKQYYADPRNHFWEIMKILFGIDPKLPYHERAEELLKRGIALWDVLASCDRTGSSDKEIQNPKPNDIESFLQSHPSTKKVFFNGNRPKDFARKIMPGLLRETRYGFIVLPSSSSSNTHSSVSHKAGVWKVLKENCSNAS